MIQLKRTIARAVAGVATVAACGTFTITAPAFAGTSWGSLSDQEKQSSYSFFI